MGKDPAFLFYSSDFITGVSDLTMEERGQYITLLCLQHQKGRLTPKAIKIAVPDATADVLAKFEIDDNGMYFNSRLELEADKRKQHSEKQRQRALDGWKKRKQKDDAVADAVALPLEDENENRILNKNKDVYEEVLNFITQEEYLMNLIKDLRINKEVRRSPESMKEWAEKFVIHLQGQDGLNKQDMREYRSHFSNWYKIQLKNV